MESKWQKLNKEKLQYSLRIYTLWLEKKGYLIAPVNTETVTEVYLKEKS